jgi:hypothetical protein
MSARNALLAVLTAVAVLFGLAAAAGGCGSSTTPPPASSGHDRERAGQPDPAPNAPTPSAERVSIEFFVFTDIDVVATYNVGTGNKFNDGIHKPGDHWTVGAAKGADVYINAIPARRQSGTISVKIENATTHKLLCHDTNYDNTKAGADCHGTAS